MRFIESILFKDGRYINLPLHQARLDGVFAQFLSGHDSHDLEQILPNLKLAGTYKVRMVYDVDSEDATYDLEFIEYQARKIETLEVVHTASIHYSYKYEDRSSIDSLLRESSADDIIIAVKNKLTDGSYFNLAFWDGTFWFTPNTPLLNGVRRTQLIHEGRIKEREIQVDDLSAFEKVSLINAMLDLGQLELPISQIKS
ncbi:aminotransferase class IV [Ekhidna sp.]|uniref:aminotransferase class IV n=1 Tax=Ekhidna sp. TaxID=2608089 RepID=UPI00329850E6